MSELRGVEGWELEDKTPCAGLRADLKICLLETDCCKKERLTPRECLKQNKATPECMHLYHYFIACKKSMVDNRTRFRGTKGY
ncbi:cytochrome c oxidase assembly factor 5 [Thrips palmi]|uniref:Cytochrome c oxidase assembly factor 5 n=1 Tax=Thrips palmi TaxID=161013 RepID=A0A6P8ZVB1_THRPL|nr:cytochrome c oxidase assembly factor 5 [Thrips palmi]XP_034249263.1 cytochrome c oxidase assembly factor 5 [Thrips palmi]